MKKQVRNSFQVRLAIIGVSLILLLCNPLFSWARQTSQPFYFEYLSFRAAQEGEMLIEFYVEMPVRQLRFSRSENQLLARYELSLRLVDSSDDLVDWTHFVDSVQVESRNSISELAPRLIRFILKAQAGDYQAELYAVDLKTHATSTFKTAVQVPNYWAPQLQLSDIQVASAISPATQPTSLVKNNWKVVPNVTHYLPEDSKTLFLYSELYNLTHSKDDSGGTFHAVITIEDERDKIVKSLRLKRQKPGVSSTLLWRVPIAELGTGDYEVILAITDLGTGQTTKRSTFFKIVNGSSS